MAGPIETGNDRRHGGRRANDIIAAPRQLEIFSEIARERDAMDAGHDSFSIHDARSGKDWALLRAEAGIDSMLTKRPLQRRECLIKVGALVVAEIESIDRMIDAGEL
jgi:hypothetical protein